MFLHNLNWNVRKGNIYANVFHSFYIQHQVSNYVSKQVNIDTQSKCNYPHTCNSDEFLSENSIVY